jgi:hypothetical protein
MIVCGIQIAGSTAIFTILKKRNGDIQDITGNFKKLQLKNDGNCNEVRSFSEAIKLHFDNLNPRRIGIIKRNKSGPFSGGAVSFKIEGLIQIYEKNNIEVISLPTLKKFKKEKSPIIAPQYKYQEDSCLLAHYLLEV